MEGTRQVQVDTRVVEDKHTAAGKHRAGDKVDREQQEVQRIDAIAVGCAASVPHTSSSYPSQISLEVASLHWVTSSPESPSMLALHSPYWNIVQIQFLCSPL